jgi:hypothetical protein
MAENVHSLDTLAGEQDYRLVPGAPAAGDFCEREDFIGRERCRGGLLPDA